MAMVEQLVELSPLQMEVPSRHLSPVQANQLESMWPRSKMVVEVRVDHMRLMAGERREELMKLRVEEHREDCLVLMVEQHRAELTKLRLEEHMAEHMKLIGEEDWAAEHYMKSRVDFLFLSGLLHPCFPSSSMPPYFSSQEASCA